MKRLLNALILASITLLPRGVAADTNLQPPLDQTLAAAPPGFSVIQLERFPHGFFGLDTLAALFGPDASADASQNLQQDGFVGGYSLQWIDQANHHALIEYVVAFRGGRGAGRWYSYAMAADLKDPTYRHADTIPGLDATGEHNVFSNGDVLDSFTFVKGNDMFVVGFNSTRDDVLDLAVKQARSQYVKAPDSTIPSDQWPENATTSTEAFPLVGVVVAFLILAALAGLGAGGLLVLQRSRRPLQIAAPGAPVALQLSPDGNFWFDGVRWVDSSQEPPPFAQRSPDGAMWWDGFGWRPVPEAARPG